MHFCVEKEEQDREQAAGEPYLLPADGAFFSPDFLPDNPDQGPERRQGKSKKQQQANTFIRKATYPY
jgi:hypothetical protein